MKEQYVDMFMDVFCTEDFIKRKRTDNDHGFELVLQRKTRLDIDVEVMISNLERQIRHIAYDSNNYKDAEIHSYYDQKESAIVFY